MHVLGIDDRWNNILNLKPGDTYRGQDVVSLQNIFSRAVFFLRELFLGGRVQQDEATFIALYADLRLPILELLQRLDLQGNPSDDDMEMVQTLLKIEAKIKISGWNIPSKEVLHRQILALQAKAQEKLNSWLNVTPVSEKVKTSVAAWIRSNETQRLFAAHQDCAIPLLWKDIPKGAVILYNPVSWELSHKLQGHSLRFSQIWKRVKTFFCLLFTGKVYTHAELCLGRGITFDLDKKGDAICAGQAKIQDRSKKVCYYDVVVPDQNYMVKEYNAKFPQQQVASFDELWEKIEEEARASTPNVTASFWDIIRVALASKRGDDYDCRAAWDPKNKHYGCSATISSLFGKFGIDIGLELGKMDQNVSPADFSRSRFFRPLYCLG